MTQQMLMWIPTETCADKSASLGGSGAGRVIMIAAVSVKAGGDNDEIGLELPVDICERRFKHVLLLTGRRCGAQRHV